jgi:hypothetical protein
MKKVKIPTLFLIFLFVSKNYFLPAISFPNKAEINFCKIVTSSESAEDFAFYSDFENEENLALNDNTSEKYFSIDNFNTVTYSDIFLFGNKILYAQSVNNNLLSKLYKVNCVYRL